MEVAVVVEAAQAQFISLVEVSATISPIGANAMLDISERCSLFLARVADLSQTELHKLGDWSISGTGDPNLSNLPSRAQLIEFLAFFRQFFLHKSEPICVPALAAALEDTIPDEDLRRCLAIIEHYDPFAVAWTHTTGGRTFNLRELTEAFISKYFHSDRIPSEIADDGYRWQTNLFSLGFAFHNGVRVLVFLRRVIFEAANRGYLTLQVSQNASGGCNSVIP